MTSENTGNVIPSEHPGVALRSEITDGSTAPEPSGDATVPEPTRDVITSVPSDDVIASAPTDDVIMSEPISRVITSNSTDEATTPECMGDVSTSAPTHSIITSESTDDEVTVSESTDDAIKSESTDDVIAPEPTSSDVTVSESESTDDAVASEPIGDEAIIRTSPKDDHDKASDSPPGPSNLTPAANQKMLQDIDDQILSQYLETETNFLPGNSHVTADIQRALYVQTPSLEQAASVLKDLGAVVLCGFPGSGKSTLARALLRLSRKEGFRPYTLRKLEDWDWHVGQLRQSAVLLDGLFGDVRVDTRQLAAWRQVVDTAVELMEQGTCRLIVTVYPHVLQQLQVRENHPKSPLKNHNAVVRLTDPLPEDVKEKMAEFHLKALGLDAGRLREVVRTVLGSDRSGPAFPWCCRHMVDLWASSSSQDPAAVFLLPAEAYAQLFKDMVLHEVLGSAFAAVLALSMRGVFYYLHRLPHTERHLLELGFKGCCVDQLAECAFGLQGSVLSQRAFSSRVLYEAAGLALGRYFRLPTLLAVCDARFLVQYVQWSSPDTARPGCVTVGSVPCCANDPGQCVDDRRALVERVFTDIVRGHIQPVSQHPCLQCPAFLSELERFCAEDSRRARKLASAEDSEHRMPLVYWSALLPCHNLTRWCCSRMNATRNVSARTLVACSLFDHLARVPRSRLQPLLQATLTPGYLKHWGCLMKCPLPGADQLLTREVQEHVAVIREAGSSPGRLEYLCDPSLPVPPGVATLRMTSGHLHVKVDSRQLWYVVFRLLVDRKVGQVDIEGNSLLHAAVRAGNWEAIALALNTGASITLPNKQGHTPYQLAHKIRRNAPKMDESLSRVFTNNSMAVQFLLLRDLTVNHKDQKGSTALLEACRLQRGDIVDLYVNLGADVNAQDAEGDTPLITAAKNDRSDVAELLLWHGAEVNRTNHWDDSPLHLAAEAGHLDTAQVLINHKADVNSRNKSGDTPLLMAAEKGHLNAVVTLINHDADVNLGDKEGNSPLLLAAEFGHLRIVQTLTYCGADVDSRNEDGDTPLSKAAEFGHSLVVNFLMGCGADVNSLNKWGETPLQKVAKYSKV